MTAFLTTLSSHPDLAAPWCVAGTRGIGAIKPHYAVLHHTVDHIRNTLHLLRTFEHARVMRVSNAKNMVYYVQLCDQAATSCNIAKQSDWEVLSIQSVTVMFTPSCIWMLLITSQASCNPLCSKKNVVM